MGFTELLLIAGISLLVIGPERLPETVRNVSLWVGRLKRGLRDARQEIEKQIGADEIRRELHNEEVLKNLEKIRSDVNESMKDVENFDPLLENPEAELAKHDANNDIDAGPSFEYPPGTEPEANTIASSSPETDLSSPETNEVINDIANKDVGVSDTDTNSQHKSA